MALPGRSITQFTVLPVALAAVPANTEIEENTLPAKLRGSGSAPAVFTAPGGDVDGSGAAAGGAGAVGGVPSGTAPMAVGGTGSGLPAVAFGRAAGSGAIAGWTAPVAAAPAPPAKRN